MNSRWGAVLAFAAAIILSPVAARADDPKGAPAHIAAAQAFLMAWGHEKWDDLRGVAADAVPVKLGDQVFTLEPASRKSNVTLQFPFRGLSTIRNGTEVTGVMVSELGVRIGDREMRGPATVTLKEEAGQFRVTEVAVDSAR
ncbi:MAG: hypothetical protein ACREJV_06315 [Candidatus Rokuibacteriota bacterium]